jgi:hypothetical protein
MIRKPLTLSFGVVFFGILLASSACKIDDAFRSQNKKKGVVAIVFTDLTKSVNKEVADRQRQNIGELFQKLPGDSKFFLFSIDRATSKPSIYQYLPTLTPIKKAADESKRKKELADIEEAKRTTEFEKLNSSLTDYYDSISGQTGAVSCIANKLNPLLDTIRNKQADFPGYDIRVYFYSDMIEQCQNSFDDKPLSFERYSDAVAEEKHLKDIESRIAKNFPASSGRSLKSMGARLYIIHNAHEDKQNPTNLRALWDSIFEKMGLPADEIVWSNGNEERFWMLREPLTASASP